MHRIVHPLRFAELRGYSAPIGRNTVERRGRRRCPLRLQDGRLVKSYCLKSSTIFLADERMIIDTEKKALRKYNESACLIISHLNAGPVSLRELQTKLLDDRGNLQLHPEDVAEFLACLEQSGLLVSLEEAI